MPKQNKVPLTCLEVDAIDILGTAIPSYFVATFRLVLLRLVFGSAVAATAMIHGDIYELRIRDHR